MSNDANDPSRYVAPASLNWTGTLRAHLELFRIPTVFTAMADVFAGFLFVHATFEPVAVFVCMLLASCLLYLAGMVLNDVYDVEVDRRDRPQRPLPSGRISVTWARSMGYGLLFVGVALGWLAGYIHADEVAWPWRCGVVATALAAGVVLYDKFLKSTPLGPVAMGACRMLNILLGMSAAPIAWAGGGAATVGYETAQLIAAAGVGMYIAGVTWLARSEAGTSGRIHLAGGTIVMLAGMALIATFPRWLISGHFDRLPMLLAILGALIGWRCLRAVVTPDARHVQTAVRVALLSLIVLDASICLAVREPQYAVLIIALLLPTMALGYWFDAT